MVNLTGTSGNNLLNGSNGNDIISGLAGNDTLNGGDGNDTLNPGVGIDLVDGGIGTDTLVLNYSTSSSAIVSLANLTYTGSLTSTDPDNPTRSGSYADDYPLSGIPVGEQIQISLESSFFDPYLQLINASTGQVISSDDDSGVGSNSSLTFTVQPGINYIIRVTSYGSGTTGDYTLTVNPTSLTSIRAGSNSVNYTNIEQFNITGTLYNDSLQGAFLNDTLNGGAGNDTLNGGAGNDRLIGSTGNDVYVVDNPLDVVTENSGAGTDTIQSSVTYTLGANLEHLTLTGIDNINGTGNTLNNTLTGNSSNNVLNGDAGNDTLNGGIGNDILIGSTGNDVYIIDSTLDVVTENSGAGTDTIQSSVTYTLGANLENLTLTGTNNLDATGNTFNNLLRGNNGNNILNGGAGNDTLAGGLGNDTYIINSRGDTLIEASAAGIDTVQSSITYTLGANFENLTLTGTANTNAIGNLLNNNLTGNSGNNTLSGGIGNDTLNGGAGNDSLIGGTGNDVYIVNSTLDVVTENLGAGTDTVQSSITYTLNTNLENITLIGTANINGTGNALNNVLRGNSGNNILSGRAGDDTLNGGAGNDTFIVSGGGNDFIQDSAGIDTLNASAARTGSFINLESGSTSLIDGGTATIGSELIVGSEPDVVFVVDVSGSTDNSFLGSPVGDVNQDGLSNTILDAEIAGFLALNERLVDLGLGNLADVAIVSFASTASQVGTVVKPLTDSDRDGVRDVEELLTSLRGNGGTNFEEGLQVAENIFTSLRTTSGNGNLIFLSDGENNEGGSYDDEIARLKSLDINLKAFGAGRDASLSSLQIIDPKAEIFTTTDELLDVFGGGSSSFREVLIENAIGGAFNDTIVGNNSNNILSGGGSNDLLSGEQGNDSLNGNTGNDTLYGDAGSDLLNGDAGVDTLIGGLGSDLYIVDSIADVIVESQNAGTDRVQSSVTHTLRANVENLILTGIANINGTGNILDNALTGNNGNNILNGGAGNDILTGGLGNDIYIVDNNSDIVTEAFGAGTDLVQSSIAYALGANLENLTLIGTAVNGTGNSLNNRIAGNNANNSLNGGAGNDLLLGGNGSDLLAGRLGNDTLIGGTGTDRFAFYSRNDRVDRISDFSVVDDRIDVSAAGFGGRLNAGATITSAQFVVGATATTVSHRFIYNTTSGGLFFDSDGNGAAAQVQIATLATGLAMTNADIFVVA
jgi:Ca2+-binding RTX toxin-like protein